MAFDAGMLSCVMREIRPLLTDGKIEKIYMPQKDECVLLIKNGRTAYRLLINAGSSSPRLCITATKTDNPETPPMFCMMLRKHLNGAKLSAMEQIGFERAARFSFETYDDLGFRTTKYLIAEIMGKFSNLILTDAGDRIIGLLRPVDFTTSQKRQLLPGMKYENPPKQDRRDPTTVDRDEFNKICTAGDISISADRFLLNTFSGMAPLTAREIAYRSGGKTDASLEDCAAKLWSEFSSYLAAIVGDKAVPYLIVDLDGKPTEYSYMPVLQYGTAMAVRQKESFSELIDEFFAERAHRDSIRQKASDILRIVSNAQSRLQRKISLQVEELKRCDEADQYRLYGDLLTANLWQMKKGMKEFSAPNYYSETNEIVTIPLDMTLQPSQNAQRYYKKYNKAKSAKSHLTEQVAKSREELSYILTVAHALETAENERDLQEIRSELYDSGYASKMKNYSIRKNQSPVLMQFTLASGRMVYCGKSNTANDYLTTRFSEKTDWWFHVKGQPGSHVVMKCSGTDDEPSEEEFTQAANIAAVYSKASEGFLIPVDYTPIRFVKKPSGSRPGYVIYTKNWTAYVTPDKALTERQRVK